MAAAVQEQVIGAREALATEAAAQGPPHQVHVLVGHQPQEVLKALATRGAAKAFCARTRAPASRSGRGACVLTPGHPSQGRHSCAHLSSQSVVQHKGRISAT